ncbi:MAG: YheT family hydrolase [Candidatus Pacearchaeota archaeon]
MEIQKIKGNLESVSFEPVVKNLHFQTIKGILTGPKETQSRERIFFHLADGSQLAADCLWQKDKSAKTIIIIHGLTGSSSSPYVLRLGEKAYLEKYNVVALNLRNCGNTQELTKTLYNAGQSKDLEEVIKQLVKQYKSKEIYIIGSSLSGNLCLKWAGEQKEKHPKAVRALAVISPVVDLEATAGQSDLPKNKLYRYMILKSLKNLIGKKALMYPKEYDLHKLTRVNTIRNFDELYQAPISGYKNAMDYYQKCSASQFIKFIRLPTLVIYSNDDPLVPAVTLDKSDIEKNKNILSLKTHYGGHVGFIAKKTEHETQFWADNQILDFFKIISRSQKRST